MARLWRRTLCLPLALVAAFALRFRCPAFLPAASPETGRRAALTAASLFSTGLVASSIQSPAFAAGGCDSSDVKKYQALKAKWDDVMSAALFEDPPGGTWEDRCIRRFGSSQFPKEAGEQCMSQRLTQSVGLRPSCANCYGALAMCTYDNCAMLCLDAKSKQCAECVADKCKGGFNECSGFAL
ncbi:unnamed protein product [Symbiodinium sp. KB8]|nr:unnamed protein product [Symbiodinium sp. KB8]